MHNTKNHDFIKLRGMPDNLFNVRNFIYQKGIRNPWVSQKFFDIFGPLRKKDEPLTERYINICRAMQRRYEDVVLHMANHIHKITKKKYLCLAGGVAWFQGGMELGPRSLGARSILADPRRAEMKDIINQRVKHREGFRPLPYMVFVCNVKEEKRSIIPGITHIDGTARLQTVTEKQNKRYWNLIREFKKLTSIPLLINTSFNVMGEPIVCTPNDAVRCFKSTGIDYLVMGNYILTKN